MHLLDSHIPLLNSKNFLISLRACHIYAHVLLFLLLFTSYAYSWWTLLIVLFLIGTAPSKLNPTVYLVLMNEITTDLSNVLLLVKLRGFGPQRHVYFVVLAQPYIL